LFEDKKLRVLLGSELGRKKLVEQIKAVVETGKFGGVNIDFEFQGDPLGVLGEEFYQLVGEMKAAGVGGISVDVFANTVIKGGQVGLERLLKELDYMVVMAYDFHRPGSQYVGPVAPIRSVAGERSITEVVERVVSLGLDKKKIVMAYPLYGYEWKTETNEFGSRVEEYVGMWSFNRMKNGELGMKNKKDFKENWDELSITPWISWKETVKKSKVESYKVGGRWKKRTVSYTEDETHQVYFENEESLRAKIELAKGAQLGGIGFWALGYEGIGDDIYSLLI